MAVTTAVLCVCIVVNALIVHGFLLHDGNTKAVNVTGSSNFLTVQSFLQYKNQQHLEIEQLRQTTNQTITILTSQLKEKLREFGTDSSHNESFIAELKDNVTSLQKELEITKMENLLLQNIISQTLNETSDFEKRLSIMEASEKSITQLDISNITKQVTLIDAEMHNLGQSKLTRDQDMLDLYKEINEISKNTTERIFESETILSGKISLLNETFVSEMKECASEVAMLNASFVTMETETEAAQHELNVSLSTLSDKVIEINQQVAFTACALSEQKHDSGYIVKFESIKTNVGVTDTRSFVTSGKFLCEHDGIYLVSVTLDAYDTYIFYSLYVNNRQYARVYEEDNKVHYQRGDLTVTLDLHTNDTTWVQLHGTMYVGSGVSCLTIAKIS